MKFFFCLLCFLLSFMSFALSCDSIENGKKTLCNQYSDNVDISK
jgi:hypothetical protein